MESKDMPNSALCMHLSSKKDVGFWLPSNEILQKIHNLYIQRNTFISKSIYGIQKMIKHNKIYVQLKNIIIFSLSLKQNVSFPLPSNQK